MLTYVKMCIIYFKVIAPQFQFVGTTWSVSAIFHMHFPKISKKKIGFLAKIPKFRKIKLFQKMLFKGV